MKNVLLALSVAVIISACTSKPQSSTQPEPSVTTQPTNTPTITPIASISATLTQTFATDLYVINYPKDMKAEKMNPTSSRIYKSGPTQKGQTEMYDGIIITIETITNSTNQTLGVFADIKSKEDHAEIVERPKNISLNGISTIKYRLRGLGEYDNYILESKDKAAFIHIVVLAEHPTKAGFKQLAIEIVNSISLKK